MMPDHFVAKWSKMTSEELKQEHALLTDKVNTSGSSFTYREKLLDVLTKLEDYIEHRTDQNTNERNVTL